MSMDRYDIRWHNAGSHLLGNVVIEGTEDDALKVAISRFGLGTVHQVRILHKSNFIFTLKRDT